MSIHLGRNGLSAEAMGQHSGMGVVPCSGAVVGHGRVVPVTCVFFAWCICLPSMRLRACVAHPSL